MQGAVSHTGRFRRFNSRGEEGTKGKKKPRAWLSGAFVFRLWRHDEKGSAAQKKPPPGHTPPEGASAHAPPGNHPTRRAYQRGGVSIAALLMARATAPRIVLPYTVDLHTYAFEYSAPPAPLVKRMNLPDRERSGAGFLRGGEGLKIRQRWIRSFSPPGPAALWGPG
jgi:hypothetical protein